MSYDIDAVERLIAERKALKVELERHKVAFDALSDAFNSQQAQLTELREAAEAYRRDERNYARLDAVLDKLAKVKP